jgi:hypothetical protein
MNEAIDPQVLAFLEADSHEARLLILSQLQARVTDRMIDTMAAALELDIAEGEVDKRCDDLRHCLLTMQRYEGSRERLR